MYCFDYVGFGKAWYFCHSFGWKPYIGELLGSLEYGKGFWEIVRWVKVQPLTIIVLVNQTCNWDFGLACCGDLYWRRILEKNVLETALEREIVLEREII